MFKLDVKETMLAQSYAAYMMASSCFSSSVCATPQMEKKAYLIYKLAGEKKQLEMEDRIRSFLARQVLCHLDGVFLSSRVEVRFLGGGNGISISDGFKVLEISQELFKDKNKKLCIRVSACTYPASGS